MSNATQCITTETARHIAGNPDCVFASDLQALHSYIGDGVHPSPQAACLFPNHPGGDRIKATRLLAQYCRLKGRAMEWRERGEIARAMHEERQCEAIYRQLPTFARW